MAQNPELENAVLKALHNYLIKKHPDFEGKITIEGLRREVEVTGNTSYKIGLHFGRSLAGYGYDFRRTTEKGVSEEMKKWYSAKDAYERANAKHKKYEKVFRSTIGTIVAEGIDDDKFGWYLVEFEIEKDNGD